MALVDGKMYYTIQKSKGLIIKEYFPLKEYEEEELNYVYIYEYKDDCLLLIRGIALKSNELDIPGEWSYRYRGGELKLTYDGKSFNYNGTEVTKLEIPITPEEKGKEIIKISPQIKESPIDTNSKLKEYLCKLIGAIEGRSPNEINAEEINDEKINSICNKFFKPDASNNHVKIEILDAQDIQNLEIIDEISFGASGRVSKVAKKQPYALKVMNSKIVNHKNIKYFINEYEIMNFLKHPNILKVFGIFLGDEKNPPSILLEYCPNNLDQLIQEKSLSNVKIVCIIYQIVEGMKYVHFQKVIHRDLKPSNILVDKDGVIKIGDFGISKLMSTDEQSMTLGIGTQKFMAPELVNEEENYDEKVDVYSFGVIVFLLLNNGVMPKITIPQVGMGKKAQIPSTFTDFARKLIDSCWNFKPSERPSFKSIGQQIEENKFNLVNLSKSELSEVQGQIKKLKEQVPFYDA